MPRLLPIHRPEFTDEQLAEARRVAGKTSAPHRAVLRARLTLALAECPAASHRKVARRCGISHKTVQKWRRRWARRGWSLSDDPRSGRPPAFSP